MNKILVFLGLLFAFPAMAQIPGGTEIQVGRTPITQGTNGLCLYQSNGKVAEQACGAGTAANIQVGTTTVGGGTTTRLLYDNAGVLGETSTITWATDNTWIGTNTLSMGPTSYRSSVDFEIRENKNATYAEIRLAQDTANFMAIYEHNGLAFIENWNSTNAVIDLSAKPTNNTGTATVTIARNTNTVGVVGLAVYKGDTSASISAFLAGTPNSNSYLAALAGNGMVAIGHAAPAALLHVLGDRGSTDKEIARFSESAGGVTLGASILVNDSGNTTVGFYNRYSGNVASAIQMGFGTTLGSLVALTLTKDLNAVFGGTATATSATLTALASDAATTNNTVCVTATTGVLTKGSGAVGICLGTSSERYKHDIHDLPDGLKEVMALRPVTYRYNAGYGDPQKDLYGFLAEEVVEVMPRLVGLDKAGRPNSVDWAGMMPVMARAIQELKAEINELKGR